MTDFFKHLIDEFQLPLENPVLIFSLILFIILLSPIVLRRLNIPGIIGLIISGVIIGPHGFNVLEKSSAVDLFSTIGLLYIMFIAGLELDLNEFKANRNKSLLFGLLTFTIPLAIGYPVVHYFLDYDFNASFLTASMFATHTLVAYPIVSRMGIAKNQAVAITVGGTILTDTAVLIILAVILANHQGNLGVEFWLTMGLSLLIFLAIMFLIIPRIAKWFFRKLESEKHSHYIFVLAVVFFAAFLAEVAGVEPIIGAFVAGLALNKLIPHSSALMNRIEFIGNSLFIPFFLISVGMLVDVKVIMSGPDAWIVAIVLSIVALSGKWIAAWFTQVIFKYSNAQRQLIFGLSGAHAAATLAVILVGYRAGILDENILNGTIILILIACIVASFATEKAAKQIILEADDADLEELTGGSPMSSEHILLPIANFENLERLLEFSILIREKSSPNPISVLTVVDNDDDAERNLIKARNKLEEFVKQGSAAETKVNIITTLDFNATSGIARITKEVMADVLVMQWPEPSAVIEKLVGEKLDQMLSKIGKTVFICHVDKPLVLHKRLVIMAPPFTEREKGFEVWLNKLTKLGQELSIPTLVFSNELTAAAIENYYTRMKVNANTTFHTFNDWEDYLVLARYIKEDDLFILASSRKGAVSHLQVLDAWPAKLEKYFPGNSKIVIFPEQFDTFEEADVYEDVSSEPLVRGLETIQKLGKGIGSIFRGSGH
ncbi:MAG: cation:proton antiporter [Chitinophagaceae bacterium]|nr:cation:proton antiporter [Chitinophagaceae bacterium]